MISLKLDSDLAMKQYRKRKEENKGKQINNSSLPAGSAMYYYCRFCGSPTETLPESHIKAPITKCDPCDVLRAHGLI